MDELIRQDWTLSMKALENKIPPPIVCLALAALMWGIAQFAPAASIPGYVRWSLVCVFLLAGLLYGPPAVLTFRRLKTTIDPIHIGNASKVVTTGPFSYSRNPMYVGMLMLLLAWASFLAAPLGIIGPIAFVLFINRFQIEPEEAAMSTRFGDAYLSYQRKVRRWI